MTVPTTVDLRVVPVALACWLVTWLGLAWSPADSILLGSGCVLAAVVLGTVPGLAVSGPGRSARRVAVLVLGGAAVAAVLVGARVHAQHASPLAALAATRSTATVWLQIRDDPRPLQPHGVTGVPRVAVRARALRVSSEGRAWRLRTDVLVLASSGGWSDLVPSQHVRTSGQLVPALSGDLTGAVLSARGPPRAVGPPSRIQRAAERLRRGLRDAAEVLPSAERGLLPGLALGDTSRLDPTVADDFRTAGLTHLLAVSGANVTVCVGAVLLLCHLLHADPRFSAAVSGVALVGFVELVRPSPSVLRAAVMGAIALVALATGRSRQGIPALSAAVLVLVLVSPDLARSAGFALSVCATAALLILAPRWGAVLRGWGVPAVLAGALAVPAAAYLITAPIIAALAGQVSLVGIPANLLAAPAVPPATVLGVLATLASPVSLTVARAVAWLAGLPTAWLATVARQAAGARVASVPWPAGEVGFWLLAALAVAGLVLVRYRAVRRASLAAAVTALLVTVPTRWALLTWPPAGWMLAVCDVGQGDALVLHAGSGAAVVVDTGPDPALVDHCLRRLGVLRVPLVMLTHLHADHAGGLLGVLRGRPVGAIETGPLHEPTWEWDTVRRVAAAHRIPLLTTSVGESWRASGMRLDVLAPSHAFHRTRSDPNNSSVVLRMASRGHTLLLTGDVEVEAQQEILAAGADLDAELLKVPHHGSAHSDPRFLAATHARVAVISVGAGNDYGHPSPVLLAELARLGMRTYRTDRDGDVAACDRHGRLVMVTRSRSPPVGFRPRTMIRPGALGAGGRCGPRTCHHGRVPARSAPGPLTLVVGEEEFLASRAVAEVAAAGRAADPECDIRELTASSVTTGDLYDLLSPALFGGTRVVVLRDAHEAGKDLVAALTSYAADPADDVHLVVVHPGGARGKALVDTFRQSGARVVECPKMTRMEGRIDFIRAEVARAGGSVTPDAASVLHDAVGNDLRELAAACSQLVSDTGGRIDAAAVTRYHRGRAEVTGFAVADRAVVGDGPGALEALRWALSVGVAHVLIADALADGVRSVARVSSAGRGNPYSLASTLGMPPWKVKRAQSQARGWTDTGLAAAMRVVAEVNADVKGAAVDPSYALEAAVRRVVAVRGMR